MSVGSEDVVIYRARTVRTVDPTLPVATAVAVRGDRIAAVGSVEELTRMWPDAVVDERYAGAVLLPGFVEAHSHVGGEALSSHRYVGFFPRMRADGSPLPGCVTFEEVIERLREFDADLPAGVPLVARGIDVLFHGGRSLTRHELDRVSTTRPIVVIHATGHVASVNTPMLEAAGITSATPVQGIPLDDDGLPTGELQEHDAMFLVLPVTGDILAIDEATLRDFAADALNHGVTTATDMANLAALTDEGASLFLSVTAHEDYPARLVPFVLGARAKTVAEAEAVSSRVVSLVPLSHDKCVFGGVKMMLDGSIQQFTAPLSSPGYLDGHTEGLWGSDPEAFVNHLRPMWRDGLLIHTHANAAPAAEVVIEAIDVLMHEKPRFDHRSTIEHCQLTTRAQYRRMAALGIGANVFANHLWWWGDQHLDMTIGPDQSRRLDAARTALDCGVSLALHSDSPVTQLDPLATASHAADRLTPSGRSMGEYERLTIPQAIEAITIGPAFQLKMDHLIGTLTPGKYADMAVLDGDPYEVDQPAALRDIVVLGTVVGGRHFVAPAARH